MQRHAKRRDDPQCRFQNELLSLYVGTGEALGGLRVVQLGFPTVIAGIAPVFEQRQHVDLRAQVRLRDAVAAEVGEGLDRGAGGLQQVQILRVEVRRPVSQLTGFREVMKSTSLSQAARYFDRLRPAVSLLRTGLEDCLRIARYRRKGRRMVIVPETHDLFDEAGEIINGLGGLSCAKWRLAQGEVGQSTMASAPGLATVLMPRFLPDVPRTFPRTSTSLSQPGQGRSSVISALFRDKAVPLSRIAAQPIGPLTREHPLSPCMSRLLDQSGTEIPIAVRSQVFLRRTQFIAAGVPPCQGRSAFGNERDPVLRNGQSSGLRAFRRGEPLCLYVLCPGVPAAFAAGGAVQGRVGERGPVPAGGGENCKIGGARRLVLLSRVARRATSKAWFALDGAYLTGLRAQHFIRSERPAGCQSWPRFSLM